ncbi:glucoamylase family protein [Paucibacter sp. APW11]|uniref:Glucoamylase family protein n=1 Tax=Roseateles aquae TaxID=3077235 RepID=A0ABU3P592_9BURK|nr:glucoamylase family protein [Paucibacter sp. APW11]MDT8997745.1 glucoamylase family protein [Paucibacter sp. APW11]
MLHAARGVLAAPIRAEIFGAARFRQHGHSLGLAQAATLTAARSAAFFPRLHDNIRVLTEAHHYIGLQERSGHHVSPAGEWLLDNFHIVQLQLAQIHEGLPRRYFRHLPVLLDEHLAGLPRVYGMAWALVAHTDSAIDACLLAEFLSAYQQSRELTLGELWALPTSLRVVLIENLRRLAERVAAAKAARELANLCADQWASEGAAQSLASLPLMAERGVQPVFALQLLQRLQPEPGLAVGMVSALPAQNGSQPGAEPAHPLAELARQLALLLPDPGAARLAQQAEEAADNLSVSNAITALRHLGDIDWRSLIAQSSALMLLMRESSAFCAEHDDTQDASLHEIEALSRHRPEALSELHIARQLLGLMAAAAPADEQGAVQASPAYWLNGAGRPALLQALGLRPAWWQLRWRSEPQLRRLLLPLYLGTLAVVSLLLGAGLLASLSERRGALPLGVGAELLLGLCLLWPLAEAVIAVANRLISETLRPHRLPRLALKNGIAAADRVLLVLPVLIGSAAAVPALVRQLQRHYLANREQQAQFALLSDFSDAATEHCSNDESILQTALQAIEALEAAHPRADGERRFLLLHRRRRWSDTEQCWMGWERKRGKLEQLVAWLSGQAHSGFIDLGPASQPLAGTPYLLTLDSDTGLPPGALRELIAVAAHPLNRPRLNAAGTQVLSGYGILQPRLSTRLPLLRDATPFHWLFAGHCGVDPYSAASSEVYHDLFDEGSFSGKGLLHVPTLQALLAARLPTGQVLSHDLLEGAICRCGGVSDISLIEDAPLHADVAASRLHRWTRGDWQLLPLLWRAGHYRLAALNRWKLLDNLRRSLVAPFSLGLLLLALGPGWLPPSLALAVVLAAWASGPLLGGLAALTPSRQGIALAHFYREAALDLARVLLASLWQLALLLQQSALQLDAISRALWRQFISRRQLLQWTTAEAAQAAASSAWPVLWRAHRRVSLATLLLATLLIAFGQAPLWTLALTLLWAGTPAWIFWASRPLPRPASSLSAAQRDYLQQLAHDTWQLFERHVNAASHDLPPDNVQLLPALMVAERTSPTNIGLYLLSLASAQRFGWLDAEEMAARAERCMATLALLPRHRGHFLNWYDTRTLAVLAPAYVSTVDSGNLCAHLLALAGACEELLPLQGAALRHRLQQLAGNARELAEAAEFGFLYDSRRRLFHIGYRLAEQQLDKSCYDLLASEARLASFWAIAKGDVPVTHWGALGRPFFGAGGSRGDAGLRSWSGSMFEYLMPPLTLAEPAGSVLAAAARVAIQEQIAYAQGGPWGISESAYAAVDHSLAYQYAPQGVPRLALRRTPADELVIAPYATLLALPLVPEQALANLQRLEALQARGELGFIEALDFCPERLQGGSSVSLVQTYMAHHQGMSLVALADLLLDGAPRRWTMADARLDAHVSLLQERLPREVARLQAPPLAPRHSDRRSSTGLSGLPFTPGEQGLPGTQLLSNGRYSVSLRGNGAGWSRFAGQDISRWRDDALRDSYGSFLFLRRGEQAAPVSLSQHPAPDPAARYQASFELDRVCLTAQWPDMRSRCTVWVSPEDDIELRQVELWNDGDSTLQLELLSMFEPVLCAARADEAHPAFSNFFIETDWVPEERALYLARRPRLADESSLHAVHFLAVHDDQLRGLRVQTERQRWAGRQHDASTPRADFRPGESVPPGGWPNGLDPVAALSLQLQLRPHTMTLLTLGTAAAFSREALNTLVDRYAQAPVLARSSLMSATFAGIRRREQRLAGEDAAAMQCLSSLLLMLYARPPAQPLFALPRRLDERLCDRRDLWRFGISGDLPLIVVSVQAMQGLRLMRTLAQALRLWAWAGVAMDLVVLNGEPRSYLMPLQAELQQLRESQTAAAGAGSATARMHLLYVDELSVQERVSLMAMARVRLLADGRPLSALLAELSEWHQSAWRQRRQQTRLPLARPDPSASTPAAQPGTRSTPQFRGAFAAQADDAAFSFSVRGALRPERPWVNVLANAEFGCQLSESGHGYSWAGNSRLQQLSAWSNDPVCDPAGEGLFVQELRSGAIWPLGASQPGDSDTGFDVEHQPGRSRISHQRGALALQASWTVDPELPLKQLRLSLHNQGARTQHLRLIGLAEWVLGAQRSDRMGVRSAMEALQRPQRPDWRGEVLLASQADGHAGFGGSSVFLTLHVCGQSETLLDGWTCDRRELFDETGQRVFPAQLGAQAGIGLDPCACAAVKLQLAAGARIDVVLLLGHGKSPAAARALALQALLRLGDERDAPARLEASTLAYWDTLLGQLSVHSPDPLFDALVNRWLLYQTLACRLWARAGFYQAGGAFGFRDQLQDAMALSRAAPELLRQQLLLSASRQFEAGDVQHWWHAPAGIGVRSHCSDDLLWLPYATLHYLRSSGDTAVLDEERPFLSGPDIPGGAEDLYGPAEISAHSASLYEHCALALDRSLGVGAHGLPLMGSGDWNDGMNRVGHQGRGESVWLAWLLCQLVDEFGPLAQARGDQARVQRWSHAALGWRAALATEAWDGQWYRRAFFDDGTPLGSEANAECRIDLIAQAWSVLSAVAPRQRQQQAMAAAARWLIDPAPGGAALDLGLLRLLSPPLQHAQPSAGYVQAYPPGVRENGGQYSHAAVWALMAQAALGQGDAAYLSFTRLSPAHRAAHQQQGALYLLEPYVMAGDVYGAAPYAGRGGWSWYTGSAAWAYRAALESICGLSLQAQRLSLRPCLPSHWPGLRLQLRHGGHCHHIQLCASWATQEIDAARAAGAVALAIGAELDLQALGDDSLHLLIYPAGLAPTAAWNPNTEVEEQPQ